MALSMRQSACAQRTSAVRSRVLAVPVRATAAAPSSVSSQEATKHKSVYVVMNVFKVKVEHGAAFEEVWRNRESHLKEMKGFVRFAMLKCENIPGKYISQTYWETKADFQNWAQSPQFKASHGGSKGDGKGPAPDSKRPSMMEMLEGPPSPEMFESVTMTE